MLLSLNQVYSTNFNGDDIKVVLDYSVRDVQNLAVDWINFKLYVLEDIVERIDACEFDGSNRVTLVAENLRSPHGLALDPTVGYVCGEQSFYLLCVSCFNHMLVQCILLISMFSLPSKIGQNRLIKIFILHTRTLQ